MVSSLKANDVEGHELIDVKLLQLFDVMYETRSVTQAAEQLGQAQPTVSIWLSQLRKRLGDPLFVRSGQRMQPTPLADSLISPAREILESLRRLATWEQQFTPSTAQRLFRLCITDASHLTLLPKLLARLRKEAPFVRLEALRIDGNTAQILASGEADLALGYIPWLETGIYQRALFDQTWVCLASRTHPRLQGTISTEEYEREGHIGVSTGTGYQLLDGAITNQRMTRRVMLELPAFPGMGAIVAGTDLIATLPRHIGTTLADQSDLQVFDCPFPIPGFTIRLHWHGRYNTDAGNKWMRQVIVELFANARDDGTSKGIG